MRKKVRNGESKVTCPVCKGRKLYCNKHKREFNINVCKKYIQVIDNVLERKKPCGYTCTCCFCQAKGQVDWIDLVVAKKDDESVWCLEGMTFTEINNQKVKIQDSI